MQDAMLVIEDDVSIHPVFQAIANELGLECTITTSGTDGLHLAKSGTFALVVLDLELPDLDGTAVCRELRPAKPKLPIVMLTGRKDEPSRILGLELGADDYISKPFSVPELTARIRVVLRRAALYTSRGEHGASIVTIGALSLDPKRREFTRNGLPLDLSKTEYEVLLYLFNRPGTAVSRDELVDQVWGYRCSEFDATVTAYLSRIRMKLEIDPNNPQYLKTIRGVGYRFVSPHEIDAAGNVIPGHDR